VTLDEVEALSEKAFRVDGFGGRDGAALALLAENLPGAFEQLRTLRDSALALARAVRECLDIQPLPHGIPPHTWQEWDAITLPLLGCATDLISRYQP
jgi:hypothetical protein